jgi:hypothetical protein
MVAIEHERALPQVDVADAIPAVARRRGVSPRQVLAACVIGTLVLAVLAAGDLPSWSERLGDSRADAAIQALCRAWASDMDRFGLTRPHQALQDATRWVLDQVW